MMNRQDVYNTVRDHLLKQNEVSVSGSSLDQCQYRGSNNLKCAIGCLIPDVLYSPAMEGHDVETLANSYPIVFTNLGISPKVLRERSVCTDPDDFRFLRELQNIHDTYAPVQWKGKLGLFAVSWYLQP